MGYFKFGEDPRLSKEPTLFEVLQGEGTARPAVPARNGGFEFNTDPRLAKGPTQHESLQAFFANRLGDKTGLSSLRVDYPPMPPIGMSASIAVGREQPGGLPPLPGPSKE